MNQEKKWSCQYCTYDNYPNTLKCSMCRASKPLASEEIYKLRGVTEDGGNISDEDHDNLDLKEQSGRRCKTCGNVLTSGMTLDVCSVDHHKEVESTSWDENKGLNIDNLTDQLRPLRISESPFRSSSLSSIKWTCFKCTYENWPKSKKCIMCRAECPSLQQQQQVSNKKSGTRLSPSRSNSSTVCSRQSSPDNHDHAINIDSCIKRSNSRREDLAGSATNNYEYDRWRREADWPWLNACFGVVEGDAAPVAAYLAAGGDPTRQLTLTEVMVLNRPSAFDVGHTLVHLAIRFQREEMLAMLVSSIDGGGSGLKRVPSYIAPELASSIRRHAATIFNTKHSVPFPFVTEFTTFVLPAEVNDLPPSIQKQLFDELLDKDVQLQLETEPAVINWSVEITVQLGSRLHALWNRSQGDCLLDSLMQVTWGVFDRDSLLRRALSDSFNRGAHLLYPRWLESEAVQARQLKFTLSEAQWAEDWAALVDRATQPGASLQQLHVFILAHVLRRPIIVYGVKFVKSFRGEDLGYAGFEGVYLPLLWEPSFCSVSPVALGYTRGHFSALVPLESECATLLGPSSKSSSGRMSKSVENNQASICYLPLVDKDQKLLPIHFLTKQEMGTEERLFRKWLDVNVTDGGLLVAQQRSQRRPLLVAQMLEEWLNHYRSLAQMSSTPYGRTIPVHELSSDGESDDE